MKKLHPTDMVVIAHKLDSITREMSNTLLRSARSTVISTCRDFSCCIITAEHDLLTTGSGQPVHIIGANMQTREMEKAHGTNIKEGDAYLDNNPYGGGSHPADHTIIVPVFIDGMHMFNGVSKAHMADIGNSIPSSYFPRAKDVYEEGSLTFPTVLIQRDYTDVDDIIRMCRARIRVPDQWYGDYLAALGAARVAEKRLKELCAKYGRETIAQFITEWFDYSERLMCAAIKHLPKAHLTNTGISDPLEGILPEGVKITVKIDIDPQKAIITADLRDNPPPVACGLNVTRASAMSAVTMGILNNLHNIPSNAGSLRRLRYLFAKESVIGSPTFPHSCSTATTNLSERLVNITQSAFAQLGKGYGLAEGGTGLGSGQAVISGIDHRYNTPYVNRIMISSNGGAGTPTADGWVTYGMPIISGVTHRDSVEIDEVKYPVLIKKVAIVEDSAGAGRFRGAPAQEFIFTTRENPMRVTIPCDGQYAPPCGVCGGLNGKAGSTYLESKKSRTKLPNITNTLITKGETIHGIDSSGGGYGDPLTRDPQRVLHDVLEGFESIKKARDIYGLVFTGTIEDETLAVDEKKTKELRKKKK